MQKQPYFRIYPGDELRSPVCNCSLAAQGLWHRMRLVMHDSVPYGHLSLAGTPMSPATVATRCGIVDLATYDTLLEELRTQQVLRVARDGSIFDPYLVRQEHAKRVAKRAGSKGGNPQLLCESDERGVNHLVKGEVNPLLKSRVDIDNDYSSGTGKRGAGGKGPNGLSPPEPPPDVSDAEIHAVFNARAGLIWSPVGHSRVKKLIGLVGRERALEFLDKAIAKPAGDPPSYALGILAREEAKQAAAPKHRPTKEWAKDPRPYCAG